MRYFFLALLGGLVLYEVAARVAEHNRRYQSNDDDARLGRIRVLNRRGQIPGEIHYDS